MITREEIEIIRANYHGRDHNNNYDKNNLGFGLFHYAFIRNLKPANVLVIGSQRGYIPAICALACKHEERGTVDFVDAGYDLKDKGEEGKQSWGGIGMWKSATEEYWNPLGIKKYIRLYNETTRTGLATIFSHTRLLWEAIKNFLTKLTFYICSFSLVEETIFFSFVPRYSSHTILYNKMLINTRKRIIY